MAELQETTEDEVAKATMEHRNDQALIDGPRHTIEEMKKRMKDA